MTMSVHFEAEGSPKNPEMPFDPHAIGIATATFYPGWYPGTASDGPTPDKIRGDLALQTIQQALASGYQIEVVDGGSSAEFIEAGLAFGANIEPERMPGMSASRRQAFEQIAGRDGVKVICYTEPEKISLVRDCIPAAAQPILDGETDIVVPSRDEHGFSTYPGYQADFEIKSNKLWNDILRRHHILAPGAKNLDAWIGPRLFRNDPAVVELFMDRYRFKGDEQSGLGKETPELWPNAIFFPLIVALRKGYRVQGVPVPYVHPEEQTSNEQGSPDFVAKRQRQQKLILYATIHFLRHLEEHPASRIEQF